MLGAYVLAWLCSDALLSTDQDREAADDDLAPMAARISNARRGHVLDPACRLPTRRPDCCTQSEHCEIQSKFVDWKTVWGSASRDVFVEAMAYFGDDMLTLHDGLKLQGGSGAEGAAEILMRAAVAALLNSAHPDVSYSRTTAQVIGETNAALASGDRDAMLILAADFDFENNLGAPLCD